MQDIIPSFFQVDEWFAAPLLSNGVREIYHRLDDRLSAIVLKKYTRTLAKCSTSRRVDGNHKIPLLSKDWEDIMRLSGPVEQDGILNHLDSIWWTIDPPKHPADL